MRSCTVVCLLLAAALALSSSPRAHAAEKKKRQTAVAVLDIEPLGVSDELARNLTALVAAEVGRYRDLAPVTRREVAGLLDYDRQRQMLGCSDDSCIAQVVGALGVDKLLSGQLGQVESAFVLTLHLVDVRSAKVDRRVSRVVHGDGRLVDAAKTAVVELIGTQASSENEPPRLAVAGKLVAHREEHVGLDASRCYDPDGDPLEISWRQLSGPATLLEAGNNPLAGFVAREEGLYSFAVRVSDGRSEPQEQRVEVEVLPRRRFMVALGYKQLLSFNRFIETDAGDVFRNRAPYGGMLMLGFKLSDNWLLTAEGGVGFMHVYPEDASLEQQKWVDVMDASVLLGARRRFAFDGFDFFAGGAVGTARQFVSAGRRLPDQTLLEDRRVRSESVVGDLSAGVDVPVGERVGFFLQGGLRARTGTDKVEPFKNTQLRIARGGLLWGTNLAAALYVRL